MRVVTSNFFERTASASMVNNGAKFAGAFHRDGRRCDINRCPNTHELFAAFGLPEDRGGETKSGENREGDQRSGSFHIFSFVRRFTLNQPSFSNTPGRRKPLMEQEP